MPSTGLPSASLVSIGRNHGPPARAAWLFARARPKAAETYTVPLSSGLIAGESLMGVAIILVLEMMKAFTAG